MASQEPTGNEEYRELAELLEERLARPGSDAPSEADDVRLRLVRLYLETLGDPVRAAQHVEPLLQRDEVAGETLELATALLDQRSVAPRIGELLSDTYARLGRVASEATTLTRELKFARSARLKRVRRRLAELKFRELDDPDGALELLEPLVAKDPGDDELRALFIEVASALERRLPAAALLTRALKAVTNDAERARVGLDLGSLYLQEAELPQARAALASVVQLKTSGPEQLVAARRLLDLEPEPGDPELVGPALAAIVRAASEPVEQSQAATRLLQLHESNPLDDSILADAYRALIDSPNGNDALAWLESYYMRSGDERALGEVYGLHAARTENPTLARSLALRRIRLSSGNPENAEQTIAEFRDFFTRFGPALDTHADFISLLELLERHERWRELGLALDTAIEFSRAEERAELLGKLGELRLSKLEDPDGALAALAESLALQPANLQSRRVVEGLLGSGAWRLQAADILEPVYRQAALHGGLLRVLETRAELLSDPSARLVALAAWSEIAAEHGADPERMLALCRRLLEADPGSPELLARLDALLGDREPVVERALRYETALAKTKEPARRRSLMLALVPIRRDLLGDVSGSIELLEQLLAEHPHDLEAHLARIDAIGALGDTTAMLRALEHALAESEGHARHALTFKKAVVLARSGHGGSALVLFRDLLSEPELDAKLVESIAYAAHDEDDQELYRRALELLATVGDAEAKKRALERLGDFQYEQLGNPRAAAESWKPAAELYEGEPGEEEHARQLYERVLEALPDDHDAARRLVELYAQLHEWAKVPEAFSVLIRSEQDPAPAVELLLRLEQGAVAAEAVDEFVSMVDEAIWRLGPDSSAKLRQLKRARARTLATNPAREDQASQAYRDLVDCFENEEDVKDFQTFCEARPSADDRHRDRRWLFDWRARHTPHPVEVLSDWAKAEEQQGELETAIMVYERLASAKPDGADWPEALCRLSLTTGDFEGGLSAFKALDNIADRAERRAAELRIARLLLNELSRPLEALDALVPLLDEGSEADEARQMLASVLGDDRLCSDAIERLEQIASRDSARAARIYEVMTQAVRPGAVPPEQRGRWVERMIDGASDPQAALAAAVRGAVDAPELVSLWDAAERMAQKLEQPEQIANAYHEVLVRGRLSPVLAETLGRRLIAYNEQWSTNPLALVEALSGVLGVVPGARWALDRVKLALSSQGRWDELLTLYDRAIAAAPGDAERGELLGEAAVVAKDLARDSERAIHYLDRLHRLRPNDSVVGSTLERLYERHGHTHELIELLSERLPASTGFQLQELRRRIAGLWFELGRPDEAEDIIERMLEDGSSIGELKALLEKVLEHPISRRAEQRPSSIQRAQKRAIELLETYYQELGQTDDLIRITEIELALGSDAASRAAAMRKLLRLRFEAHAQTPDAFAEIMARLETEVAGDKKLAKVAYETLLLRAISRLRQVRAESAGDAAAAAFHALGELKHLLVAGGWPGRAVRLLWHASHLSFEHHQRRELLGDAAAACSMHLDDPALALRIYRELFAGDAGDDVAAGAVERFAELLERLKRDVELAELRELRAASEAARGNGAAERAEWERAAEIWERQQAWERAVEAHHRSAQLGSLASLESLARIHVDRSEWRQAAEALEQLYESAPPDARADVALRLSDAYLELGEPAVARARLEHALSTAPETDSVRARLLSLYRRDSVLRPLAELLKDEARRTADPAGKLALLREAAGLLLFKLDDATEAAAVLDDALGIAPHDLELCLWRADALGALERWDESITLLRTQLEGYAAQRSKERARVHHRLARVLTRAGRPNDALVELRLAADMHQSHPAILFDLGKLALSQNELEAAEAAYRALVLALHHSVEDPIEAPDRAEVYLDLAEIAARRGEPDRASDLIDSAFDAVLTGSGDAARFEKALRERGQNDLFVRAVLRRVESQAPIAGRIGGLQSLAEFWNGELGRSPELAKQLVAHADRLRRELQRESHRELDAWLGLAAVETLLGDRNRLVRLLESAISEVGAQRSRPLRIKLAASLLEDEARREAAIAVLSKLLEDDPEDGEAADLLASALEQDGRLDLLVTMLEERVEQRRSSGIPAGLAMRLARVLEKLDRTAEALATYESVLSSKPSDRGVLQTLSERLAALNSERLADCLELYMSHEPAAVPVIARRLLELRERSRDQAGVLRALKLGFSAEPKDGIFRDRLVKLYEENGNFIEAARVLGRALEALPRDKTLLRRLIEAHRKCGDDHQALEAIERALSLRPKDPELLCERADIRAALGDYAAALTDLESAGTARPGSLEAQVELLQKLVDRASPELPEERNLLLVDLLLRAKRQDLGRTVLEALLSRSPNHIEALKRAAALASADADWAGAINVYRRLLGAIDSDPRELASVTLALTDACERAGRASDAREALERALERLPDNAELAQKLERLYIASGDSARLAELLVTRVERQSDRAGKLRLLLRAAKLLAADSAHLPRALEVAELARGVDPENIDALLCVARLEISSERPAEALALLEQALSGMRGNRTPIAASLQLEIAKARLAMDEIFPAFDALKAGYAIDRKNGELCYLLGLVALDLEDEKTADKGLHSVTMLSQKEDTGDQPIGREIKAVAFYRLALLALAKSDSSRARRFATKAVAEDQNNAAARALLDELGSSTSLAASRQY